MERVMRIADRVVEYLALRVRKSLQARRERAIAAAVADLPAYLLKDIGWPAANDRRGDR